MKKFLFLASLFLSILVLSTCTTEPVVVKSWHHPLYLDNSDFWRQRIPVVVQNNSNLDLWGDPVVIDVGRGKGQIPLKGVLAEGVRITNADGNQLLYRITTPDGKQLEKGPIPGKSTLSFPMECDAGQEFSCFVYYDNSSAWPVGEYFYTHREVSNPGFELPGQFGPIAWELDWPQENRDVEWSDSEAHTGTHSLVISSESAAASTPERGRRRGGGGSFGASQSDVHLLPGETYVIEAWFKTENLEGEGGLVLSPANLKRTKRSIRAESIRLTADSESGEWTKVSAEFTGDPEANVIRIGTFLNGTGKLWVDDVSLTCKADYNLAIQVLSPQKLPITEVGKTDQWLGGESAEWPVRASIMVPNFTDSPLEDYPVYVDVQMLLQRLFDEIDEKTVFQVTDGTDPIPYLVMGNAILFRQDIPASTVKTFYVYFNDSQAGSSKDPVTYTDLSEITANLIANPTFEDAEISGWERFGESSSKLIAPDEEGGNPLVKLTYIETGEEATTQVSDIEESHTATDAEIGLYQVFDVKPGSKYLFSARVKSSNILDRTFTLRAHFLDESGEQIGDEETRQANPDMHQNNEWVKELLIVEAPLGSKSVKVELVNTVKGMVWYDDVFFMEVGSGFTGALAVERKAEGDVEGLQIWEKDPVAKAFPDDLPKGEIEKVSISAAKRDTEPLQLLFRSQNEYKNLEVKLENLTDKNGNTLDEIEIGVVGYVPVSYPSNYIRDFVTPFWRTKLPFGTIGSDGWIGWWADPILPFSSFDLPANETKAAWIEVGVPEDAQAGNYTGNIQVVHNGQVIREIPLEMQVYDFTLPDATSMIALYVLRFNERYMFGREKTSEEWKFDIWKLMKKHRVSPKAIEPEPRFTVVDGNVVADFTEFDKAGEIYFNQMNFQESYSPHRVFYLFGWGRPPSDKFGEAPYEGEYPYHDADHSKLRPEYKRLYQQALRLYWDHMKEKGWADKTVIYISDEPHADEHMNQQMYAVCDMIHEVDPEIPIYVSTWWYRPEFEGYVDVWGLSHRGGGWGHPVPAEHLELAVKNGGRVYFTTDGMPCTDSPYLGFERMLPYFCFKYGASEYEFWASNWHTLNPYNYGWHRFHRQSPQEGIVYWMRYPNGDGNFIYPGQLLGVEELVTSVRLKQAREGVEDYEFMNALDQLVKKCSAKGIETDDAKKALDRARSLVDIPSADGRYTTGYMPDPALLMEIRHEIATSIEDLSSKLD